MHQLSNYIEHTRKRVKNIEDIKGTSKCVRFLQTLEDNNVPAPDNAPKQNETSTTPASKKTR
jgi:hypothetical protein